MDIGTVNTCILYYYYLLHIRGIFLIPLEQYYLDPNEFITQFGGTSSLWGLFNTIIIIAINKFCGLFSLFSHAKMVLTQYLLFCIGCFCTHCFVYLFIQLFIANTEIQRFLQKNVHAAQKGTLQFLVQWTCGQRL